MNKVKFVFGGVVAIVGVLIYQSNVFVNNILTFGMLGKSLIAIGFVFFLVEYIEEKKQEKT